MLNRGLPPEFKKRYFGFDGDAWTVDRELKDMIKFQMFNLQDSPALLGPFDIVFCRYVAIYFTDVLKAKLYNGIASSLASDGHLVISAIENLRGVSDRFAPFEHAGGTYYQRL